VDKNYKLKLFTKDHLQRNRTLVDCKPNNHGFT